MKFSPLLVPQLVLVPVLAVALAACDAEPSKPKRMNTVKLLPDTLPPPPPPKVEEKRPEPQKDDKPQPQTPQPKPMEAPQQQALRSDEAAGTGPGNGLVAGEVTKDYVDQKIGQSIGGGTPAEALGNRLAANTYANAATRALNEFLSRDKDVRKLDYQVRIDLWLTATGRLQRAELVGSTGNPEADQALRDALARFPGTAQPLPDRMPQPMRLLVTNRMMG